MRTPKGFRCTYEWDEEVGRDERGDKLLKRHVCLKRMHHDGEHRDDKAASAGPKEKVK